MYEFPRSASQVVLTQLIEPVTEKMLEQKEIEDSDVFECITFSDMTTEFIEFP